MKINLTLQRAEAIIARCLPKVQGQNEALSYSVKGISVLGEKMDFYTPETPIEKIRKDMGNATKDIIIFNHNEDTTGKGTLAKILLAAREEGKLGKIKYPSN